MSWDTVFESWNHANRTAITQPVDTTEDASQPPILDMERVSISQPGKPDQEAENPTFPKFLELPAEIRIKIWALSANSDSRTINLQWLSTEFTYRPVEHEIPPTLLACRESHLEGLAYFTKCDEHKEDHATTGRAPTASFTRQTYIHFAVDVFDFQNPKLKTRAHRVAIVPPGRLNFDQSTIMRIQNLNYAIGPFLKPLKALLNVQESDSRLSIVFRGRTGTPDQMRMELLLGLHIRLLPSYIRKLPNAKLVYQASNGTMYPLTGDPLEIKLFLRSQTSF